MRAVGGCLKFAFRATLVFSLMLLATVCKAEWAVVVNPAVEINSLEKSEVARIFMKKSKTLPNGEEVIPLSQASRADVNEAFFAKISGQNKMQRDAYWARLMFTGKGRPPEDAKSNEVMKQRIAEDKRYIGYVDAASVDSTVKVVCRIE